MNTNAAIAFCCSYMFVFDPATNDVWQGMKWHLDNMAVKTNGIWVTTALKISELHAFQFPYCTNYVDVRIVNGTNVWDLNFDDLDLFMKEIPNEIRPIGSGGLTSGLTNSKTGENLSKKW